MNIPLKTKEKKELITETNFIVTVASKYLLAMKNNNVEGKNEVAGIIDYFIVDNTLRKLCNDVLNKNEEMRNLFNSFVCENRISVTQQPQPNLDSGVVTVVDRSDFLQVTDSNLSRGQSFISSGDNSISVHEGNKTIEFSEQDLDKLGSLPAKDSSHHLTLSLSPLPQTFQDLPVSSNFDSPSAYKVGEEKLAFNFNS